ncbi:CLUMA_CG016238, isoform A [Clunio marinus]|uniref:CLUMA_CG016238, isoform A n=1 Tax=Clunio marinus TaxID=568069 RepID=A0A1J1IUY8_9DIPT|nr:CLUMA_CG016238, isoform A [Clunio marinus]
MEIKWTPWFGVSWKRRFEVFSAFCFIVIILFIELFCVIVFSSIFYYGGTIGKGLCILYLIFIYIDRKADEDCSRGQGYEFLRGWFIWKRFTEYFPLTLVKTVDIPATKNYIFACFPHGVISCGIFGHFVTSTTNFGELFPGIRTKLCTLNYHFFVPIFREIGLGWGMMSAKSSAIKIALTQPNSKDAPCNADGYTSNAPVLVVGGARESLNARPGIYKLVLKNRKGFIKISIVTGAPIVPIFSFNEVEVYDQVSNEPGTKFRKFQDFVKKHTGIAPIIFFGRGFLQYSFGLTPRRRPIFTVIGAPIEPVKNSNPSMLNLQIMLEKTSTWYSKHVKLADELKKNVIALLYKPEFKESIKSGLEVFSTFIWSNMVLYWELSCIILYFFLFLKGGVIGKMICIWYATHMYVDRKAPENGGRGQGYESIRTWRWFHYFTNFFPVSIVKTVDLPPTKNYLFAVFPHGVISVGVFCNFCTSTTNFRKLFPGIRSKVCTLNYHFFIPFYREIVLAWGMMSVNYKSIMNGLSKSNNKHAVCNYDGYTSNAIVLIVGGAQEALNARPGDYRLVLKKRKGFVKIAIQSGASLVPVFSFGEIDILKQPSNEPGTKLRKFQDFVKKVTGIAPVIFYGRGFFSERSFGFLPYRRPITTVVGAPIEVLKNSNPTHEEIDDIHGKYMEALAKLFNDHKDKYVKNADNVKLIIE